MQTRYWDMRSCGEPYLDLFIAIIKLAHFDAKDREDWLRYDAMLFLRWAAEELENGDVIPLRRQHYRASPRWAPDDTEAAQRARWKRATQKECDS